jgi:hypothetical protein
MKLSHFRGVYGNIGQCINRFHARRRAPLLHSICQGFGNAGVGFWPVKKNAEIFRLNLALPIPSFPLLLPYLVAVLPH